MWPFSRKPSPYEIELAAVKTIPEVDPEKQRGAAANWWSAPVYGDTQPPLNPPLPHPNRQTQWARPPIIDRFPTIIGANLNGQYLSSAFRLCNSGYRYQFVDVVDELIENDPDARALARARTLGIACGRYSVQPAELPEDAPQDQKDLAKKVADHYALDFSNIPCRRQRIQQLAWADCYGVTAEETIWEHPSKSIWTPVDLSFIHSRRLNYTNPVTWDLFVYDQGLVGPGADYMGPTVGVYGLAVAKYPGKFIVHTPALSGQYPTRDGEARNIAYYMLLKRMVMRCTAQDFERLIRPWVVAYFNREMPDGQKEPFADRRDIAAANEALDAFGTGSMNSACLPNSVKVELLRAVTAMSALEFLSFINRALAKAFIGQSFTTEPGPNGNEATAKVADKNTDRILLYSAEAMCDTLRRDLSCPWLWLNYPNLPRHFAPRHVVAVADLPTPEELIKIAKDATLMDIPVDSIDIGQRTTLKLVAHDDENRTRNTSPQYGPNPPEQNQDANTAIGVKNATPPAAPKPPNGKSNGKPPAAEPKPTTNN